MIGADGLVVRSLATLTALAAVWVSLGTVLPLQVDVVSGLAYIALFGGSLVIALRGSPRAAAALVVGTGVPALCVQVLVTGGPYSPFAAYFPLSAMVAWAWLGRRWAIGVIAGLYLTLLVGLALPRPPPAPDQALLSAFVSAALIGVAFLAAVVRDLRRAAETAWQRAGEAARAAEAAHAASEARDRFLSAVSHELRTPLDTVLGYAELLLELEDEADRRGDLDRIHFAGRQLLALVDDLLSVAHGTPALAETALETFAATELLSEVVETTAPLAHAGGNTLTARAGPDPIAVHTDRRRVRQILLNLVSNAAKYTRRGAIELSVDATPAGLRWTVRDSGIGIPADKLGHLFQPFVQLHEGAARQPGVGLGLAVSQKLAERLGGRIEADSEVGVGSTFVLHLPRGGPPRAAGALADRHAP